MTKRPAKRKAREVWLHTDRKIAYGYEICVLQNGEKCGTTGRAVLFREVLPRPKKKASRG